LTFIVSTTLTACGQTNNKPNFEKVKLDIETVDFIEITNRVQSDTSLNPTKGLSNEQINLFVEKFNSSKSNGLRKAIPLYFVDVHLKDGTKRKFRINGQYIKENDDYFFDLGDSEFIESIWTNLNVDHIKNIRYVFDDYTKSEESTDSQDDKDLLTKSLKSLTVVTIPEDLELLINVWMYYDPTDFPSRGLVYEVLKENKTVSIEAVIKRINNKKEWESDDTAPYSDLVELLKRLEIE